MSLTSDVYILESNGIISNYGYIVNSTVRRITNLTRSTAVWGDQRGWGSLFPITVAVRAMLNYTLVFSTYLSGFTGPISITALGNSPLIFTSLWLWRRMNKIDVSLITHLTFNWLTECLLLLLPLPKYLWLIYLNDIFFVCLLLKSARLFIASVPSQSPSSVIAVLFFNEIKRSLCSASWTFQDENAFAVELTDAHSRLNLIDIIRRLMICCCC